MATLENLKNFTVSIFLERLSCLGAAASRDFGPWPDWLKHLEKATKC
jgi:hypothetical protein